jgi:hypothetical protein
MMTTIGVNDEGKGGGFTSRLSDATNYRPNKPGQANPVNPLRSGVIIHFAHQKTITGQ